MSISQAEEAWERIVKTLKLSKLVFSIKETPFSAFITVKQKFIQYKDKLQLLQNENVKLKKTIGTLKASHVKEICQLINIIDDKSQSIRLVENELALSLRNSNTSLLHPSEIIDKKWKSQFYFFDTL